jgi:hypothetical protein
MDLATISPLSPHHHSAVTEVASASRDISSLKALEAPVIHARVATWEIVTHARQQTFVLAAKPDFISQTRLHAPPARRAAPRVVLD